MPCSFQGSTTVSGGSECLASYPAINPPFDQVVDHRLGRRVISESTANSTGHDALRIIMSSREQKRRSDHRGHTLDALIRDHAALQQANEERLPIVEYVTKEELEASDDTES